MSKITVSPSDQLDFFPATTPLSDPASRNDVRTGDAAEMFVIAKLLKWGFDAHDARRDLPYDVVVDFGEGHLCRVQVKGRSNASNGKWHFHSRRGNWRSATGTYDYQEGDFDLTAFVALSLERVIFSVGLHRVCTFRTEDFVRPDAELSSWHIAAKSFQERRRF